LFRRFARGIQYLTEIVNALLTSPKRKLLEQMFTFSRSLPQRFDQPLPAMMAQLTPPSPYSAQRTGPHHSLGTIQEASILAEDEIRRLADAVAAWHFWSPLGICLRRSLLRYHFLRAAGVPVSIVFGARLKEERESSGLGGHAWLTLNGKAYFERPGDYEGFVEMYVYPPVAGRQ
jgi:hypothetical protein